MEDLTEVETGVGAGIDPAEIDAKISEVSPRKGIELSDAEAQITRCIESKQQYWVHA